ncbi:YnbE family lipoprotein [Candidatus Bealeia paramacronuclearis]|uniref:YnbE family lipoprotein n=1 Tax=Candidatus Bealeia paramacronuclearis TaxID=1921001 RepID=UPI0039C45BCE
MIKYLYNFRFLIGIGLVLAGCQPTVQLQAPEKPIVVNMNVDVKLKVERDVQEAIKSKPGVF